MILSYCDLSATPAFQTVVADVTPELGDRANKEVFRDYMEHNGRLRTAEEIINKLSKAYFSTIPARPAQALNTELNITQTEKFKDLGRSVPKKQLSNNEIVKLKQTISKANNDLVRRGINRVYRLEDVQQVGQSDNYTWKLAAYPGSLDTAAKSERIRESVLDSNFLPNPLQQVSLDFVSYKNEPSQVDYKLKVIAALESDKVRQPSKNLQGFYNDLKRQGVSDQQIDLVKGIYKEGTTKEFLISSLMSEMTYAIEIENMSEAKKPVYVNLTVPGGTGYSENEIRTPAITPIIKSHGEFATPQGIGWFRSDDQVLGGKFEVTKPGDFTPGKVKTLEEGIKTNTRRILEVQSDLGQKGRNLERLAEPNFRPSDINDNKFLQILNKKGNWITVFLDAIIQDSARKGYDKVLFPAGSTANKVEGQTTVDEFIQGKKYRINALKQDFEKYNTINIIEETDEGVKFYVLRDKRSNSLGALNTREEAVKFLEDEKSRISNEIKQLENEIKAVEDRGFGSFDAIYKFYEETIGNILKKQQYNPKRVTDEHGNDWYEIEIKPEFKDQFIAYKNFNQETTVANYSQEIVRNIAEGLKLQVGVDFAFISPEQATEITKSSVNPWKGQNAFFYQNKAYFIAGGITPSDVLHEFVHPIIKSISDTNKPLFNNLYSKIQLSDEGKKIIETVSELYPDLDRNGDDFKEEVLVRGIEQMRDLNSKEIQPTNAFQKFINDLLYAIKQLLREVFGQKIKVQNLSPNTTLQELSNILEEGGKFELDPEIITDKDLVAYKKNYNDNIDRLSAERLDKVELQNLVDKYFDAVSRYIKNAKQKDLGPLSSTLYNEFGTGELERIKQTLKPFQGKIPSDAKQLEDEVELTRQRAQAVVNTLGNLDNLTSEINEGLKDILKSEDTKDNIERVQYYQGILNYWGNFAKEIRNVLESSRVSTPLVDRITGNVERANVLLNEYYFKAVKEALWGVLKGTSENLEKEKDAEIVRLKKANASQNEIDKVVKHYDEIKLTKEKVESALNGSAKDITIFQSFLEAASYSPDPVYGGLANFIKDNLTELNVRLQKEFNESSQILKPLLDKAGANKEKLWELGKDIGQIEKVGETDSETGEFKEREVWRYKNQFIGADFVRDKYFYDIRKASEKYAKSRTEADRMTLEDIQEEWSQHRRDYFHQEFTEEYYKRWDLLKGDEIGREAKSLLNNKYDELNELVNQLHNVPSDEVLELTDEIEAKRREISALSSLYDLKGDPKKGKELEIAKRIQLFNEKGKDINEHKEIPGAFQKAYRAYEEKLQQEGKNPAQTVDLLTQWKSKNVRAGIKEEFWVKMDAISKAIKDIMSKIPQQEELTKEIDDNYRIIKDLVKGNRDESGQPLGTELSPEKQEKVRLAQERIDAARTELDRLSGLSKSEQNELNLIMARLTEFQRLTDAEQFKLRELMDKQGRLRLNKVQRAELRSLFNELDELRSKEPTDSYVDTVNDFLSTMNSEAVYDVLGYLAFDKNNIGRLSNMALTEKLFNLSDEFKEWFQRNHLIKDSINYETNEDIERYERTYVWNVIKPRDEKYYDTTTIQNIAGETIKIQGLPSLKFYKSLVKDEYKTKVIIGVTTDNRGRGYWLPKTMEQGAKDDRYINKEYTNFKQVNPDQYNILEALKKIHLKAQEGLDNKDKLYLDYARFPKEFVERVQSDNAWERIVTRVKDFFRDVKYKFETGFNPDADANLIKMDLFDIEGSDNIPIGGLYRLPIEEVSTDVVFTTMKYMASAERNKQLKKVAPVARMIQKVLNEEKYQPSLKKTYKNRTVLFPNRKKDRYIRAEAVDNLIERQIEGIGNKGWAADSALAQNFSNFVFQGAGTSYLGLNFPSALKNQLGMKFQGMVEAVSGKNFTWKEFVSAEVEATQTALKSLQEIYESGPKSYSTQLAEIFDPEGNRFDRHFAESLTRTPKKDWSYLILQRMNDFRRLSQYQASLQTFFAMMRHQKITGKDGKVVMYKDAWEIEDGKIQLKDNYPAEWGITYDKDGNQIIGEKFKQKRLEFQRVLDNLNGAMRREDSVEADRYLAFRWISFFRRFLTSMLTNRFAKNRYDFQLESTKEGFYRTTFKLLIDTVKNLGRNLPYMNPAQKQAALRFFAGDVGLSLLLKYIILGLVLGYDDDDKDRFKKLKANSDALQIPFAFDDPNREFNLGGWFENHAILQALQIGGENSQFLGLNLYKDLTNIKSIALGPSLNTVFNLLNDVRQIATGDEKAVYQRSAGAYTFNQEGDYKIFNHIGKALGFTSSTIDPSLAAKLYESSQNR